MGIAVHNQGLGASSAFVGQLGQHQESALNILVINSTQGMVIMAFFFFAFRFYGDWLQMFPDEVSLMLLKVCSSIWWHELHSEMNAPLGYTPWL